MKMLASIAGGMIEVAVGDITRFVGGAIVNAANSSLLGGSGVDGAIHAAGGPDILEDCRRLRTGPFKDGLPAGGAVSTCAGRLAVRRVIHTVGPVWRGGGEGEDEALASCYRECLRIARSEGLGTVAFPAISTGIYGFPKDRAARVACSAICDFLADPGYAGLPASPHVTLVFFSESDARIFLRAMEA